MSAEGEGGLDVSGDWDGMYSYPSLLPPVSFRAHLVERRGALSGVIEDEAVSGDAPSRRRAASMVGRRLGFSVRFLKSYQDRAVHDDVEYEGAVSADGAEISGRWSIFGQWSGTFLMVRRPNKAVARTRRAGAQTRA